MKRILCLVVLLALPEFVSAQSHPREKGTIVRMRMAECLGPQHAFMMAMSGAKPDTPDPCPEYVLVADKVVYVIVGKTSDQLIPLAEETRFRLQKNEMLIRIDDAMKESHFHIKAMLLRAEWDRHELLQQAEASVLIRDHAGSENREEGR